MTEYQNKIKTKVLDEKDLLELFKYFNFLIEYRIPKNFYDDINNSIFICYINDKTLVYEKNLDVFILYHFEDNSRDYFKINGLIFKNIFDLSFIYSKGNKLSANFYRNFFEKWAPELAEVPITVSENLFENNQIVKKVQEDDSKFPKNRFVVIASKNRQRILYDRLTRDYVYVSGIRSEIFTNFDSFVYANKITHKAKLALIKDIAFRFNLSENYLYPELNYSIGGPPLHSLHKETLNGLESKIKSLPV